MSRLAWEVAEVRLAIPGTGDGSLSMNGTARLGWWYAHRWLYAWSDERFEGDEELLRANLSKPGEVKTGEDYSEWEGIRFHVTSEDDLKVFEDFARGICKQAST